MVVVYVVVECVVAVVWLVYAVVWEYVVEVRLVTGASMATYWPVYGEWGSTLQKIKTIEQTKWLSLSLCDSTIAISRCDGGDGGCSRGMNDVYGNQDNKNI